MTAIDLDPFSPSLLSDPARFVSGAGVGLLEPSQDAALKRGRTPLLEFDGAEHAASRALAQRVLDATAIRAVIDDSARLARPVEVTLNNTLRRPTALVIRPPRSERGGA